MAELKLLLLLAVILTCIHSSCGKMVNLDTTLSNAICKQMENFKASKTIQPALQDKDTVSGLEGCGWVNWKQCPQGKDCSSFHHKPGESCPAGKSNRSIHWESAEPARAGGSPPGSAGGAVNPAGKILKMSWELEGQEQCYYIDSSAKVSYKAAAQKCKDQGGRLLAIESKKENVIVQAVLAAYDQHKNLKFWTDAELTVWGNRWHTGGHVFEYNDPSLTHGRDNCMTVKISNQTLKWLRSKCTSHYFTFCEMMSSCEKVSAGGAPAAGTAGGGGRTRTGSAPLKPPSPPPPPGGSSDTLKAGRIHISGSLSRSICGHMKTFRSSKKLQEPLNDKDKFASGDNECSWMHWQQQCESQGSCAPFLPKSCSEVKVPSG